MTYSIETIPVLNDNYVYAITCSNTGDSAVIDCGESIPIINFLGVDKSLKEILLTHHHADHIGGVESLKKNLVDMEKWNDCSVVGNGVDTYRMGNVTKGISGETSFNILDGLEVQVLSVSGHTIGDIAYYIPKLSVIFTGDLLFTMGCGRMFEGTYEMFFESLQKIKLLPTDTRIYGGHEYTSDNIAFVKSLGSMGKEMSAYIQKLQKLIDNDVPTVPVFLENELKFNPFLQIKSVAEFKDFRLKKDGFKGYDI